jgi:hypothetical protein
VKSPRKQAAPQKKVTKMDIEETRWDAILQEKGGVDWSGSGYESEDPGESTKTQLSKNPPKGGVAKGVTKGVTKGKELQQKNKCGVTAKGGSESGSESESRYESPLYEVLVFFCCCLGL